MVMIKKKKKYSNVVTRKFVYKPVEVHASANTYVSRLKSN